ncbi:hypothetical protein NO1_0982, partial [Candidatus Termititenax aidoneus]
YILMAIRDYHGWNSDHEALLFRAIYNLDRKFVKNIIRFAIINYQKDWILGIFSIVWDFDDGYFIINNAIDYLYKTIKGRNSTISHCLKNILSFSNNNTKKQITEKRDGFVKNYIRKYINNPKRIKDIFDAMYDFDLTKKQEFVIFFCKINSSFSFLKELNILPGIRHWSGSKVSAIEEEIKYLKAIRDTLNASKYLEHRVHLDTYISSLEKEKDRIILQEFLKDDGF